MHYVCIVLSRRESVGPRHSLIRARAPAFPRAEIWTSTGAERDRARRIRPGIMNSWSRSSHFVPRFFIPFLYWNRPTRGRWKEINRECQKRKERGKGREGEIDGGTVYRVLISWKERGTIRRGRFYSFSRNHPSSSPLFDNDRILLERRANDFFFLFKFLISNFIKIDHLTVRIFNFNAKN